MRRRRGPLIFAALLLGCLCLMVQWYHSRGYRLSSGPNGSYLMLPVDAQVEQLEALGFVFSQRELDLLSEIRADMDAGEAVGYYAPGLDQELGPYYTTLFWLGLGHWDDETWEWSPTSSNVYALDMEVFELEGMYLDFFSGLQAVSKGSLPITDMRADNSQADWERGTGTMALEFSFDGTPHRLEMRLMYDWLDPSVLDQVNAVLEEHGVTERFYGACDGYQGLLVVYGAPDWARRFQAVTGITLYTKLS